MNTNRVDRGQLWNILVEHFTDDELETLCFQLDIDYDGLDGAGKMGRARELIRYCENRNRLSDLIDAIRSARPAVPLTVIEDAGGPAPAATAMSPEPARRLADQLPNARVAGSALVVIAVLVFAIVIGRAVLNRDGGAVVQTPVDTPVSTGDTGATASNTAEPTTAPESTVVVTTAPADAQIVDDFELPENSPPGDSYVVNTGGGNAGGLSVTGDPSHIASGEHALVFTYSIVNTDADPAKNYAGFDRSFQAQDWSGHSQFCAWIQPDAATRWITIGISSGDSHLYEKLVELKPDGDAYCIPLQPALENVDLSAVTSYQFYIGAPFTQKEGAIHIDHIQLLR